MSGKIGFIGVFWVVFPSRPKGRTPRVEDSPRPSITDRLAHLCASRELLEFYRGKVTQFDGEHEDLLEKYRCTTEDQHKLQWEVGVSELQKALREREQALRLYSENNILKIREREDSKRIQHLLALVGPDIGGITYSHSDPPFKVGGRSPGSILPHCLMSHYMTSDRERYLVGHLKDCCLSAVGYHSPEETRAQDSGSSEDHKIKNWM
ncbi:coiled-coil domain-containing protein 77 [Oncorhynchus tshawytscha]|uniref:coiled-coil domain-containing protein 77 n=1 Tax=Oncorhynchus tshawytscha TaxID=74940 RepID=UPI001C3CBFA0|nr:coiled-coil domain-containing protein 77 [Oncorhynchus tshawytscha]